MNGYKVLSAVCCLGMVFSAGCASKSAVMKNEPVVIKDAATVSVPAAGTTGPSDRNTMEKPVTSSAVAVAPPVQKTTPVSAPRSAFDNIYFDFDSTELSESARTTLTHIYNTLTSTEKNVKLSIIGNCDERGSAEYNLALGERRARAAAKYLTALGVQPERLSTVSYGKERPAVPGNDETSWSKNRRDEFVIQNQVQ